MVIYQGTKLKKVTWNKSKGLRNDETSILRNTSLIPFIRELDTNLLENHQLFFVRPELIDWFFLILQRVIVRIAMKIAFEWLWILITDSPKFHEPLAECLAIASWTGRGCCSLPMAACFLDFGHTGAQLNLAYDSPIAPIFWQLKMDIHNSWSRQYNLYVYIYVLYIHI